MLDRNEIERIAASVHSHEVLRNHCILEARAKNPDGSLCDYSTGKLPPLIAPIAERAAWWSARGIERHPDEFYVFYHAIARILRPRVIAEIGVWHGYALMAMVTGSLYPDQKGHKCNLGIDCNLHSGPSVLHVYGFDNESYPGAEHCLDWCSKCLNEIEVPNTMLHCDSRQFDATGLPPMKKVDMWSIDGDHSYQAAYKDLVLAEKYANDKCVYVVDDCGWALSIRDACDDFAAKYGYDVMMLPSLKGSSVLSRGI